MNRLSSEPSARRRASQTQAMLIKRMYEIDPLACPECRGVVKVVVLIELPEADVLEEILRHCGLWCPASPGSCRPRTSASTIRTATGKVMRPPRSPSPLFLPGAPR